eukprot:Gb_26343 [translate_table: standard]
MASLRRSDISFRRHGSSGLVWADKFISLHETDEGGSSIRTSATNQQPAMACDSQERPAGQKSSPSAVMGYSRSVGSLGTGYRQSKQMHRPYPERAAAIGPSSNSNLRKWIRRSFSKPRDASSNK